MKLIRGKSWLILAIACALAIVALTLFPYDFSEQPLGSDPAVGLRRWHVVEFVLNTILFIPPAYALAREWHGRTWTIVALAAALSVLVEAAQLFLPQRHTSPADLLANALGAYLGVRLARWPLPRKGSPAWPVVLGAWLTAIILTSRVGELDLVNWRPTYGVALGDEIGGGRAYRGRVHWGKLCVGSGTDEVCDLVTEPKSIDADWARIAEKTQAFRLEVEATPADTTQSGPARLITWSEDPSNRNTTLGQEGKAAVLRVRTRSSTQNGTWPSVRFPGAFAEVRPGARFHASAVWRKGEATLRLTGADWRYAAEFRLAPAALYGLRPVGEFLEPERRPLWDGSVGALLSFPAGLLAAGTLAGLTGSIIALISVIAFMLLGPELAPVTTGAISLSFTMGVALGASAGWSLGRAVIPVRDGISRLAPRQAGPDPALSETALD